MALNIELQTVIMQQQCLMKLFMIEKDVLLCDIEIKT